MVIVLTKIFNSFNSLGYILMNNKTEDLYRFAFTKFNELIPTLSVRIIADFEIALLNAITEYFSASLTGSFFHFS